MTAARQVALEWLIALIEPLIEPDGEFDVNPSGEPSNFPALYLVEEQQDADDETEPGATRYALDVTVEGYVTGGGGKVATAARSALYLQVVEAVMGAVPPPCVEEIHEGRMLTVTTVLAAERRLGFALAFRLIVAADSISPVADA